MNQKKSFLDPFLLTLLQGKNFSESKAEKLFGHLFSGKLTLDESKSLLLLLAQKGETADELIGCLKALRKLEKPIGPKINSLMDTCGTGGDHSQTLNISTLTALLIASCGGKVAKHGNRAITSKSGSSDLLEAFGVKLDASSKKMIQAIRKCGIGYFHAPFYHPVFAKLQKLRQSLKQRTILNMLGPLVNPLNIDYQLVGVASKEMLPLYAKALLKTKRKGALVCHSFDGMDEISTAVPTRMAIIQKGRIRFSTLNPGKYGLKKASKKDLRILTVEQGRKRSESILKGKDRGAASDVILLNAACGLWISKKVPSIEKGIEVARKVLRSGKPYRTLQSLKKISKSR